MQATWRRICCVRGVGWPTPADLFIRQAGAGQGLSKKWTIQLSRRVTAADGTAGVIVASLDPVYFEDIIASACRWARLGGVALVGATWALRTRVIGGQSSSAGLHRVDQQPVRPQKPKGARGLATSGRGSLGGVEPHRFHTARWPGIPLYLLVITSEDEALSNGALTRSVAVWPVGVALSLAVLLGVTVVPVSLQRHRNGDNAALPPLRCQRGQGQRTASQARRDPGRHLARTSCGVRRCQHPRLLPPS